MKSLLKHAQIELEVIPRSPWEGLDIEQTTTYRRRPWTEDELKTFFSAPLHTKYVLPTAPRRGGRRSVLGAAVGALQRYGPIRGAKEFSLQGSRVIPNLDAGKLDEPKTPLVARSAFLRNAAAL